MLKLSGGGGGSDSGYVLSKESNKARLRRLFELRRLLTPPMGSTQRQE